MSKILYVIDNNEKKNYSYHLTEDTIIYHFSINSSPSIEIYLDKKDINLNYYYNNINYDNNNLKMIIRHEKENTHSEVYNHGVNIGDKKLDYYVEGIVPKNIVKCVCNQENQIINLKDGKSSIHPNLLIDNYDVESNHSAYIGKIKEEKLFYLMSRGLSRKEAYKLLINAFLINMDSIEKEKIKEFVDEIKRI